VLDVSTPVTKASAAALISDCAWARATAVHVAASPVCAEVASVTAGTLSMIGGHLWRRACRSSSPLP